jgi:Golgi SNAP receptor complex protein 1
MTWDEARRCARRLETALDAELGAYAKLAASADDAFGGGRAAAVGERGLSAQQLAAAKAAAIDKMLAELDAANDGLKAALASAAASPGVPADPRAHTAARHASVARDLRAEYGRLHATVMAARERAALFGGAGPAGRDAPSSEAAALLRERGTLAASHSMLDDVLGTAAAAGASLLDQRGRLGGAAARLAAVGDRFPVVAGLLASIRRRRDRDSMIVSGLAGACAFVVLVYWWRK